MSRRTMRFAGLLVAVATLVAACGSGSGNSGDNASTDTSPGATDPALNALTIVKHSVATTRASQTARISHHLVSEITAFSANEISQGVANLKTGDGEWTHDMSDTPTGLVPSGTPKNEIVADNREIGKYLYVSMVPAFKAAGINQAWVRVPAELPPGVSGFKGLDGMSPRIALSARFERPTVAFDLLDTVTGAREVGTATVRGKRTTRYSIDVKLRRMLESVGLMFFFGNPTAATDLAKIDELCKKAAHVDVFVDDLGRIRQLLVDADLTIVAPEFKPPQDPRYWRSLRIEWDFYDYGVKVAVAAPTTSVLDRA